MKLIQVGSLVRLDIAKAKSKAYNYLKNKIGLVIESPIWNNRKYRRVSWIGTRITTYHHVDYLTEV